MEITLALDWTPNTNHTGFYVAQAQGLYRRLGLDVRFLLPDESEDAVTSPARVANGQATFGLCPSEVLMSYHLIPDCPRLTAVAAILQKNTSAFVATRRSGRSRPAQLDGCTYASCDMQLESALLSHMIRQDGGRGDFNIITPPVLAVPEALAGGRADAAWLFMHWGGLQLERRGIELNVFRLEDCGIPYGYTPLLIGDPNVLRERADEVCVFMQATARGFEFAAGEPEEAARLLIETARHPALADEDAVRASQHQVAGEYLARDGRWGSMNSRRWQSFANWICEQHLFKDSMGSDITRGDLNVSAMFTNQFL